MPAMKAAVLRGPLDLHIETSRPLLEPGEGEVLVRVAVAGLCGTDYSIYAGDRRVAYPRVMGHEFVGQVATVGAGVTTVRVGDRVAVEPNYSCGACPLARFLAPDAAILRLRTRGRAAACDPPGRRRARPGGCPAGSTAPLWASAHPVGPVGEFPTPRLASGPSL